MSKKPFIDELMELCKGRGYSITAVDIDGDVVEVIFNNTKVKKDIPKDFHIMELS